MKAEPKQSLRTRWARASRFIREDLWEIEPSSLTVRGRFGVNTLRVIQLVWRDFRDDECQLHASALTFSTMMAIVPILALSLALARGLGGGEVAKDWIRDGVEKWTSGFAGAATNVVLNSPAALPVEGKLAPSLATGAAPAAGADPVDPTALANQINRIVELGFEKIENVSFGALGGVGLALLVWMVLAVLGRVESSFNRVWGVTTDRPLLRKFTDYLSVIFVLPLLLILASSLPLVDYATRFFDPETAQIVRDVLNSGFLKHGTVFLMTSLAFTFLIMFVPNTKVRPLPGFVGGVATAVSFLIWLWVCAALQVGAANAGKIYGSFATLPILLLWVNVSWQIIFLGAEVAFAVQNCTTYRMEHGAYDPSVRARLIAALSVVTDAARGMLTGQGPFRTATYSQERRIPVRLLRHTLDALVKAGLLAEVADEPGSYALLRAPDTIPVKQVLDCVLQAGVQPGGLGLGRVPDNVIKVIDQSARGMDQALAAMTVRDVVGKV